MQVWSAWSITIELCCKNGRPRITGVHGRMAFVLWEVHIKSREVNESFMYSKSSYLNFISEFFNATSTISGSQRWCIFKPSREARLGQMRTRWAPLSISALVFTGKSCVGFCSCLCLLSCKGISYCKSFVTFCSRKTKHACMRMVTNIKTPAFHAAIMFIEKCPFALCKRHKMIGGGGGRGRGWGVVVAMQGATKRISVSRLAFGLMLKSPLNEVKLALIFSLMGFIK